MSIKHIKDNAGIITEELRGLKTNSNRIEYEKQKKQSDVIKLQRSIE